jgi:hypothetical protein
MGIVAALITIRADRGDRAASRSVSPSKPDPALVFGTRADGALPKIVAAAKPRMTIADVTAAYPDAAPTSGRRDDYRMPSNVGGLTECGFEFDRGALSAITLRFDPRLRTPQVLAAIVDAATAKWGPSSTTDATASSRAKWLLETGDASSVELIDYGVQYQLDIVLR